MSELTGLIWLVAGLSALFGAAGLCACCVQIRSSVEFALAAYVLAWAWLVALTLGLSAAELVTRGMLAAGIGAFLLAAVVLWFARGCPAPPSAAATLRSLRLSLHVPANFVLAVALAVGGAYSIALAFFTPANDGDALSYHLARASFWRQEHGLGYVSNAVDVRLNANPPNAEIGQLATMLLSGSDRYVALPQLGAYGALVLCVAVLGRRLGLTASEALFGTLAFATLPVVVLQASGALNDLVVASFLAVAVLFAFGRGWAPLALLALAIGLALGTKLTAVLALPTLVVVLALVRPRREWLSTALAGLFGLVLGSAWYVLNVVESGELDGGLAEAFDQRLEFSLPSVVTNAMRLILDLVDMSGAARPYSLLFPVVAGALATLGLWRTRRSTAQGAALLAAAILTATPFFAPEVMSRVRDQVFRTWVALGRPATAPFELGWNLNVEADPVASWYGPLGVLLLVVGTVTVVTLWLRKRLPTASIGLTAAPWLLLLTLALTIVWDPWRGRFLVFGISLAASTWGLLLRSRILAGATAAIGTTALVLSLANYLGKPSGLHAVWSRDDAPPPSLDTIWDDQRWEAQARLRPEEPETALFGYVEENIPHDANLALAPRANDYISPYFGPRNSRHLLLIAPEGGPVPAEAEWLVISPSIIVRRCREAWRRELMTSGWRIERRIGADECLAR